MTKENVEKILGFDGTLSQKLDGFEYRPQQIEMAQAVEEALEQELARFEAQLFADRDAAATEVFQDAVPYTTGVAAGGTDTRSDWQKWKDSFKKDWAVAK